jgi:hypothetical protein
MEVETLGDGLAYHRSRFSDSQLKVGYLLDLVHTP